MNWQTIGPESYALAESPFWHAAQQSLVWVDIVGRRVLRANIYMGTVQAWDLPSEPGCVAPAHDGGLVLALRDGIYRASEWGAALRRIAVLPYDSASVRANDGKCDAQGRLWVSTVDESKRQGAAALYSVDARAGRAPRIERHIDAALTGNGLAWSPDQRTLYWADTPTHTVQAWDFDAASGTLAHARTFLRWSPKPSPASDAVYTGRPDGACVDVQGNYWVALYEGQRVCQYSSDGRLLTTLLVPACCPTMPCLGGEDGRTLFVTSARHGRSAAELQTWPQSGCVFQTRVSVPGNPVHAFVD